MTEFQGARTKHRNIEAMTTSSTGPLTSTRRSSHRRAPILLSQFSFYVFERMSREGSRVVVTP